MEDWKYFNIEKRGAIQGKAWLFNGKEYALFKPDSEKRESEIEFEVAKIARNLKILCAKVEIIIFDGLKGTLSYNTHVDKSKIYCPADKLYYKSNQLTYQCKDTQFNSLSKISKLTMDYIRKYIPQIEIDVVKMLFLDCLVSNRDRHGDNWELIMDTKANIISLAPLFDHGLALENGYDDTIDYCLVVWEGNNEIKHFDMFEKLCMHYPEEVHKLLEKSKMLSLSLFVKKRLNIMLEIQHNINIMA